ncbi:MAG: DNA/RNA-binding domain of Phe-tRNA-synthetase-like protein [Ancylomarina sp.]|jgi:DNA/RNA-binding domain of Phe-tRNA-synthetase-like protein
MNHTITIESQLSELCPTLKLGVIECQVSVAKDDDKLWEVINQNISQIEQSMTVEDVRNKSTISSSKDGYRKVGKDPNRYRLSAESLLRRIVNGKGLYKINNVVDLLNLASVKSGFSIGGYNADKVIGTIKMGLGQADEAYEGIGRGQLNVENLPLFRDNMGAFGSATSDSLRTHIDSNCQNLLMVFFSYQGESELHEAMTLATHLLTEFTNAKAINTCII